MAELERQRAADARTLTERMAELAEARRQLDAERRRATAAIAQLTGADRARLEATERAEAADVRLVELRERLEKAEELAARAETERARLLDEVSAEMSARRQMEQSAQEMEKEVERLSNKYERETRRYSAIVHTERQEKTSFVQETERVRSGARGAPQRQGRVARKLTRPALPSASVSYGGASSARARLSAPD